MLITQSIDQTRQACRALRPLALVPTMGALHAGHRALIRRAHQVAEHVAVSIFVNPTQFAPHEDYQQYPRPMDEDLAICRAEQVDLVFCPTAEQMYPADEAAVQVSVPSLARDLEAASRPGFFDGVCRVVAKLFGIFLPEVACFGMKDYQQMLVVEALARGLCLPVRIERCPTVREADGLACSSRNRYLSAEARRSALGLFDALQQAQRCVADRQCAAPQIEQLMAEVMTRQGVTVDYAAVRDAATLEPVTQVNGGELALVAGRVAGVRLIDNQVLQPAQTA